MNCRFSISVLSTFVLVAGFAQAMITKTIDLGTVGETYPIVEPDVVEELLQTAAEHGIKNNSPFSRQVKSYQPANLHTLPSTTANRTFLVDIELHP